jgi:anthranilate synthase
MTRYRTAGGIAVDRITAQVDPVASIEGIIDSLDAHRGVLLASAYEYPGRYTRWDIGFVDPPIQIVSRLRTMRIAACNERGALLLAPIADALRESRAVDRVDVEEGELAIVVTVREPRERFPEEERSRQPSVFSVLREIIALFHSGADRHLGLYGAFGYDLAFQFEPMEERLPRPADQRDLVLYLPDELITVDHGRHLAERHHYEFEVDGRSTDGLPRRASPEPYRGATSIARRRDHAEGEFADVVRKAKESFKRGDLFEVVPGQTFFEACPMAPSEVFRRLRERNPAPFSTLMNLGDREYLVGASPEMYVRVDGRRVESCPISGTIGRGEDVLADADRMLELLNSEKETAELTMCTDVDRNDKSRICEPGSVRILGRRQIEVYSRVIHTVDHVEGYLRKGFDALDAFLTHMWAVTVTGAPKLWAMRFLETTERSSRGWYGGALGHIGFDGNLNTGLTLRTVRIQDGVAAIRAGGTLLIDSDPDAEERETEIKAAAFIDAIRHPRQAVSSPSARSAAGPQQRVLLVDYEDSFIHTLADYVRQTGAQVTTVRGAGSEVPIVAALADLKPDLVVLSPGPGTPSDFAVERAIALALERSIPLFGVCLGMQAIVEYFGGSLALLDRPVHGRSSPVNVRGGRIFTDLPERFVAGRYHSLYALREALPPQLAAVAETDDGTVMAIEHVALPIAGVQFHPESLMTLRDGLGLRLIENVVRSLAEQERHAGNARDLVLD